jgi:hypothetical protein
MAKTKTWTEKFNSSAEPVVKPVPINIAGMKAGQIMLIPTPKVVADMLHTIPPGKSMDVTAFRAKLAKKFGAEVTCPITLGFHLRTVAEAAFEQLNTPPDGMQDSAATTAKLRKSTSSSTSATSSASAQNAHSKGVSSRSSIAPFWRVLDMNAATTKKLSFDPSLIAQRRAAEGIVDVPSNATVSAKKPPAKRVAAKTSAKAAPKKAVTKARAL